MKKIIIFSILLISYLTSYGQNIEDIDFINTRDSLTTALLTEYDYHNYKRLKLKKRLDSIKIDKRIELIRQIEGKWEFIEGVCADCIMSKGEKKIKKYVEITRKEIIFYKDSISKNHITAKEKLNFSELFDSFSDLTTIIYNDKTAWSFSTDITQNYLSVSYIGKEQKEHIAIITSGITTSYYKRIK